MAEYAVERTPPMPGVPAPASLATAKQADQLVKLFEPVKRRRQAQEREWKLNLAFYKGDQYAWFNKRSDRIERLPTEDGDKPRWRVRLVNNQILPAVQGYVSMLTKTKPVIYATPGSGSDHDIKAAQVAEKLFEWWWQEFVMDELEKEALVWSTIGANGWWKITWDAHAGKKMTFLYSPEGQVITDERLASRFRMELQQAGIDPRMFEQTIHLGDIKVEALSPFDVYVDNTARTFAEARWAVCKHSLSSEEIKRRWGVDVKPDAVSADYDSAVPFSNARDADEPNVKAVYFLYYLPGPECPKGRYVVWCEKPNTILYDGPWELPHQMLPLVQFPGIRMPGRVEDEAIITHARPIQKEINKTISQIVQMKNLTVAPQMLAPVGSMRQRPTNEPNAVIEYAPINGAVPEWRQMPAIPPYVFEHLREMQGRIDRLFNITLVGRGEVPPNVEAGLAIDLLQETAVDQVAPVIQSIENALARAGKIMISLAHKYYVEERIMKIRGEGGRVYVEKFKQSDIDGGVDFRAEAGSGLPRTRAMRMMRIKELVGMQVLRPDQALKYLDLADMNGVRARLLADEEQASREIDKLLNGEPINPEAVMEAQQALMQGMNPETGQPLVVDPATGQPDPMEIQQVLEKAAVQPTPADNHASHLDILALTLKSVEFESWPPDARKRAFAHYEAHQAAMNQPPMPEPEAPRTSLSIHSTLGPTATSKILQQAGVQVSPQEAMEPPLESVVIDTIDKPDADEAGNDPLTAEEKGMWEAEALAQKARAETAKADLEEKRVKQSDFSPKPPAGK